MQVSRCEAMLMKARGFTAHLIKQNQDSFSLYRTSHKFMSHRAGARRKCCEPPLLTLGGAAIFF
jgi:hypothetical protein